MNPTTLGALWIVGGMAVLAVSDNFVSAVALVWAMGRMETLRARAR